MIKYRVPGGLGCPRTHRSGRRPKNFQAIPLPHNQFNGCARNRTLVYSRTSNEDKETLTQVARTCPRLKQCGTISFASTHLTLLTQNLTPRHVLLYSVKHGCLEASNVTVKIVLSVFETGCRDFLEDLNMYCHVQCRAKRHKIIYFIMFY